MAGRFEGPVGPKEPHPDDEITVYHTTSPENAEHLRKYGTTRPKVRGWNPLADRVAEESRSRGIPPPRGLPGIGRGEGLYVSRHPGEGIMYGTHSLPVRIKARDLGVSPEMEGSTPWKALNRVEGYIPHMLQPHQFGDVYTHEDWREWENQHG